MKRKKLQSYKITNNWFVHFSFAFHHGFTCMLLFSFLFLLLLNLIRLTLIVHVCVNQSQLFGVCFLLAALRGSVYLTIDIIPSFVIVLSTQVCDLARELMHYLSRLCYKHCKINALVYIQFLSHVHVWILYNSTSLSWFDALLWQDSQHFILIKYPKFLSIPQSYETLTNPAFRLGPVYRGQFGEVLSVLRPTVHTILKCPHFPGTITAEWFRLCVRSQCHHISRMRTFDENSCAISITSPRSLSPQHFVPGPNMFGGTTGRSPGERPHYGIAKQDFPR